MVRTPSQYLESLRAVHGDEDVQQLDRGGIDSCRAVLLAFCDFLIRPIRCVGFCERGRGDQASRDEARRIAGSSRRYI